MVRQTKRFKKGLNKKVLSAILAASMIMTSSSFAFASTTTDEVDGVLTAEETNVTSEDAGVAANSLDVLPEAEDTPVAQAEVESHTWADGLWISLPGYATKLTANPGTISIDDQAYAGGEEIKPILSGKSLGDGINFLEEGTDYVVSYSHNTEVTDDGAEATITFIGGYSDLGVLKVKFQIAPISLANATVDVSSQEGYVYNGKEQYPEINSVTVKSGDDTYTLSADDYDVEVASGTDLVNVGPKTFKIVGKGNFGGECVVTSGYNIQQAPIAGNVTVNADQVVFGCDKAEIEKAITVVDNFTGDELDKNAYTILWYDEEEGDYAADNTPSTDIGVHTFRVTGNAGNFSNETYEEGTYEIVKDGTLQMAVDKLYGPGCQIGGFKANSDGTALELTYDGEDHYSEATSYLAGAAGHIAGVTGLKVNQFEVVENKAEWENAGEYAVTIEGKNDYAGETATLIFKINPKALNTDEETVNTGSGIEVKAQQGKHASGTAGSVVVTVNDGDELLTEGKDYTYVVETEGKDSVVVITGIGNYTTAIEKEDVETLTVDVDAVDELPLSDPSITAEVTKEYKYTGKENRPVETDIKLVENDGGKETTLKVSDFKVIEYRDNIAAGEATVVVEARDNTNYTGTREITFNIAGESFEDTFALADIKDFDKDDATWDAIKKAIKVVYQNGGATYAAAVGANSDRIDVEITKDGEDVDFSKAPEGGVYDVTVTPTDKNGAGRYEGELTGTFNVVGDDLKESGAKIADIADVVYTGEAIEPAVVVTVGNKTLKEGEDYTVSYSDNIKGGEATAIVTGIGDYSGTLEKNFNITRAAQGIEMTNPLQERDLGNGSRNSMSKACTLKLATTMADEDTKFTYTTSDPSVATVNDGKITYQGVGECTITVSAAATDSCEAASLDIKVVVGNPGTPTFTPSITKNTAKKAFVVTSSTVRGADGFEVQYSIRDDFWKATTKDFSGTKSKLLRQTCTTVHSNMTYYVRVRAYQVVDGEKVYSTSWSPVKTIKTK